MDFKKTLLALFLQGVFLCFLPGKPAFAGQKTCLPLDREELSLQEYRQKDRKNRNLFMIDYNTGKTSLMDPNGRFLIYNGVKNEDPVMFFDLQAKRKREFLPSVYSAARSNFSNLQSFYEEDFAWRRNLFELFSPSRFIGFSDSGSFAYAFLESGFLKIWDLPSMEERKRLPIEIRGDMLRIKLDESSLWILERAEESVREIEKIEKAYRDFPDPGRSPEAFMAKRGLPHRLNLILRKVDLKSGEESRTPLPEIFRESRCSFISEDMSHLFFVTEDGALYQQPLAANAFQTPVESGRQPLQLFGPVEGFRQLSASRRPLSVCAFSSDSTNILKDPKRKGYIIRRPQERREFFLPLDEPADLDDPLDIALDFNAYGPFLSFTSNPEDYDDTRNKVSLFHMPSGQTFDLGEAYHWNNSPLYGVYADDPETKKAVFQIHRLSSSLKKPEQSAPLFQIEKNYMCSTAYLPEREDSSLLIHTVWGDIFAVDMKTGAARRHFIGRSCGGRGAAPYFYQNIRKASAAPVFILRTESEELRQSDMLYQFSEICFEPPAAAPENIPEALLDLSEKTKNSITAAGLSLLTSVIETEEAVQSHPALLRQVLWNVFISSPLLYAELFRRYPSLSGLEADGYPPLFKEEAILSLKKALRLTVSPDNLSRLSDWQFLRMLSPLFKELEDQDTIIADITSSLMRGASRLHPELASVFPSKLYYIISGHVKELFGLQRKPVSDITLAYLPFSARARKPLVSKEDAIQFKLMILSSDPIEGHESRSTDFGLHYSVLLESDASPEKIKKGGALLEEAFAWKLRGGERYRAKVHVAPHIQDSGDISYLSAQAESPDYESAWRDKRLTGMVLIGSSFRDYSEYTADQYLSYLESEGFEFSTAAAVDFQSTFLEWIENCKIDYWIRQGHPGGNERDILRFDRFSHIVRAVRYKEDGLAEEIFIVFPEPLRSQEEKTFSLSNNAFAKAFAARDQKGCGQLTYFNTICWSSAKARYELGSVHSSNFLNIPSTTETEIFENTPKNAIYALLHSYRGGKDFEGFRAALQASPNYQSGRMDHYIFPDEADYQKEVMDYIRHPLKTSIDLEVETESGWERRRDPLLAAPQL